MQVAKKLVRGDYKSGRVKDPTAKLSSRHEKTVKNYVKEFLDKAVKKKEERDRQKAARVNGTKEVSPTTVTQDTPDAEMSDDDMDAKMEMGASNEASPADSSTELKRKHDGDEDPSSPKKSRTGSGELQPPPPPPPPPPAENCVDAEEDVDFENMGLLVR